MEKDTAKTVTGYIASFSVSAVIGTAAKVLTAGAVTNPVTGVMLGVGGLFLSGMAGKAADKYAREVVDDVFDAVNK